MQPKEKFRAGLVSAAVFEREVEGANGKFPSQSVALQISYKNKEGEFVSNSLTIIKRNLAAVIQVLTDAQTSLALDSGGSDSASAFFVDEEDEILAKQAEEARKEWIGKKKDQQQLENNCQLCQNVFDKDADGNLTCHSCGYVIEATDIKGVA